MKHITLDREQEAILRQTLGGVSAFLMARAERRDPAGFISKAYRLQDRKVANLQYQLDQPPTANWQQIDIAAQAKFCQLLEAMLNAKSSALQAVCYLQIHAFIMSTRAETDVSGRLSDKIQGEIEQ